MKYVLWAIGGIVGLGLAFFAMEKLASERIEVVELHTTDSEGAAQTTRLWIVDDEGYQYLRVGGNGSGWFSRILANGEIELSRNGDTARYTVVQRPEKSQRINDLMQQKYTWGDSFIAAVIGSREGSIPLELHPRN